MNLLSMSDDTHIASEIDNIYSFFSHRNCRFAFLHCIAEYPALEEHIQLDFLDKLQKLSSQSYFFLFLP